jgi:nucleoid-associated protein YgaU
MTFRGALLTFLLLALTACAKPPQFELEMTEQVIDQANALHAEMYAATELQAANEALRDGRVQMKHGAYGKARNTLELALEHARRAVLVTQEAHAKEVAEELAKREAAEQARQAAERARIKTEEARRAAREAAEAKRRASAEKQPPTPPQPVPVEPALTYKVGEGETLWTISAQESVYNDALLWPLLYQANRDQIKDPRQIFPGQVLNIRRDIPEKELEEARQKARLSDIFPVPGP